MGSQVQLLPGAANRDTLKQVIENDIRNIYRELGMQRTELEYIYQVQTREKLSLQIQAVPSDLTSS